MSNPPITRGAVPEHRNQRKALTRHSNGKKKKKKELGNANSKAAKDVAIHIANKRLVRINEDSLLIYKGKQENFFFFKSGLETVLHRRVYPTSQ